MIILIPTIKYGSNFLNNFTMGVCSNYHGYFFRCIEIPATKAGHFFYTEIDRLNAPA